MIDFVATFIFFFAVIDPIGTVPVFVALTRQYDEAAKKRIARIAVLASAAILIFFVAAGELLLGAMGIPLSAFQIAGGIILFLFAMMMIFGESKPEEELKLIDSQSETAIFPLAVPSIAGPGAMLAAVLMTEKTKFGFWEQTQTAGVMLSVLVLCYICFMFSMPINRVIGKGGASLISRVMGVILASLATSNALAGIKQYFSL